MVSSIGIFVAKYNQQHRMVCMDCCEWESVRLRELSSLAHSRDCVLFLCELSRNVFYVLFYLRNRKIHIRKLDFFFI